MDREFSRLVSVIIPCYNQGRFLAEAVQSALDQDYPFKEIIVVNDGSPDNTDEVASAFSDSIIYIKQDNMGLSGARNTGIQAAKGEYIAFLDSDDVYLEGSLAKLAGFLDVHPDTGLVCGDALLFDENGIIGPKSDLSGRPKNPDNFRWETVEYYPTPSTMMIRRICFERVGLFEEELRNAAEDWQMCVRISRQFDMSYLEQPLVQYRVHSQSTTQNVGYVKERCRRAVVTVVSGSYFQEYPAHFRAKLLFYRFATAWRSEPKTKSLSYFLSAFLTDPTQIPYGLKVIRQGLSNVLSGA